MKIVTDLLVSLVSMGTYVTNPFTRPDKGFSKLAANENIASKRAAPALISSDISREKQT